MMRSEEERVRDEDVARKKVRAVLLHICTNAALVTDTTVTNNLLLSPSAFMNTTHVPSTCRSGIVA